MCVKPLGVIFILCSIAVDLCDAGGELINVTNETCGTTYTLGIYDRKTLLYNGERDFENLHAPCGLTMVNYNPEFEICIQLPSHGHIYTDTSSCRLSLKYFMGYLPKDLRYGYRCHTFSREPLCTTKSNVYAVFVDEVIYFKLDPVEVDIFTRIKATTTTERVTPKVYVFGQTTEPNPKVSSTATVFLVFGGLVAMALVCVCCRVSAYKTRQQANRQLSQVESQQQNNQLSNNRPTNRTNPTNQQTNIYDNYQQTRRINAISTPQRYNHDAPSYEDVVRPSAPYLSESVEPNDSYTPDRRNPLFYQSNERSMSSQDESSTSVELGQQTSNQTEPLSPPPRYEDLDLPPPYPIVS